LEIKFEKRGNEVVYTFDKVPTTDEDIKDIENYLKEPSFAPAFFLITMCGYEKNKEFCFKVLDILNGPKDVSNMDRSYYEDRFMDGKFYKPYSYFEGATPDNNYEPNVPYVVHVYDNPNGPKDEGYKGFLLQSSGSDNKRQVTVRLKPSVSNWYLTQEMLLADIRIPKKDDEWA
jgi:hypothetical protein